MKRLENGDLEVTIRDDGNGWFEATATYGLHHGRGDGRTERTAIGSALSLLGKYLRRLDYDENRAKEEAHMSKLAAERVGEL